MIRARAWPVVVGVVLGFVGLVPFFGSSYHLALAISVLSYLVLATAWAMFSGPTRYISLATAAFFGIGAYTVAEIGAKLPWPLVLIIASGIGVLVALVVGLSTLRLSGIYFVIFSFGLAELVRQLATWYQVNVTRSVGRYVFLDIPPIMIFWQLFGLAVLVFVVGWMIARSRLGLALKTIGEDEGAAIHAGLDATRVKLFMFAVSAAFAAAVGAVMAPRWTYIDPSIAFNSLLSFQVVIMALLGGAGTVYGPLLGAVPLVLLFEAISTSFPNAFSIVLGTVFIVIVYFLPNGVAGFLDRGGSTPPAGREPAPASVGDAFISTARADAAAPLLHVEGLRKAFGGLVAVEGFRAVIPHGAVVGLIGPNGSGKTTVINAISGAVRADAGSIRFTDTEIRQASPFRIARMGVARTFQLVRVFRTLSCRENVLSSIAFRAEPLWGAAALVEADQLLDRVGLTGKAHRPAAALTYVDQKRLELARALALRPKLLLLDEWLAGLNPAELEIGIALIRSLQQDGLTVLMVEHVMDAIRSLCGHAIVMSAGKVIAEGAPATVLANPEVIRAYLGDADA